MSTAERRPIRRALLSVFDKTGIVDLARTLAEQGAEIVSTGSTASTIRDAGIAVTEVEAVTGFPEMLDGPSRRSTRACTAGSSPISAWSPTATSSPSTTSPPSTSWS